MLNRSIAPPITDAVNFRLELKPYEKFTLDNGVPVYAINAGAEEVMSVEIVFFAGNSFEEKNIVAAATNFLLKNGTSKKKAFQVNEHFEYYGSFLNRACYNETSTLTLHCLNKHISELLPVVEELISFYNKYYKNGNCVIFSAGKLPLGLFELLNKHFGKLPFGNNFQKPLHQISSTKKAGEKFRITNDENGVQGSIRIGREFPNRPHPDFLKVMVLNNIFGGYFGSRLMANIREDKGYTYGIHSYLQDHIQQSSWLVSTEAGKDVCEAAISEVYKEMKRLQDEPVGEDEMQLVRNYMMGSILGDLDGPFHIIARWKNYILNDVTGDYFYNAINTIRTVSPEELQQLAKKYLNPDEFYELVVV